MRLTCALAVLSAAMVFPSPYGAAERGERMQAAGEAAEPFRIIGNIYYVGGQYGSYLITTPEGHILHDTGTADMHALIVSNVEKLGFDAGDIRIIISSHAHWDHVERTRGHEAGDRRTGGCARRRRRGAPVRPGQLGHRGPGLRACRGRSRDRGR